MTEKKQRPPTEFITPEVRLAFPALFKPKPTMKGGQDLAYQAVLLVPPTTPLTPFVNAIRAAMVEKWGRVVELPRNKAPIKSCSEKPEIAGFVEGWHFINTKNEAQPAVVGRNSVPLADASMVYAGCWIRCFLNAYCWDNSFGKGVSFGLHAVQFVRDDERLDGRRRRDDLDDVFEPLDAIEGAAATPALRGGKVDSLDAIYG